MKRAVSQTSAGNSSPGKNYNKPRVDANVGTRPRKHSRVGKIILHDFAVALHWFEVGLAVLSVGFVVLGVGYLVAELGHFEGTLSKLGLYHGLEEVLADILLLVVGIEFAIMLIRRTPESLVEVMFFVIARKMLIKSHDLYDIIIGVVALAGLFAIRKYLEHHTPKRQFLGRRHAHAEGGGGAAAAMSKTGEPATAAAGEASTS